MDFKLCYNICIVSIYGGVSNAFIAISINHRTADVALREQVAFRDDALRIAHEDLYETKSILENVILSTCNRTEVYAVVDQIHTGRYYIQRFLARAFGFEVDDIKAMSSKSGGRSSRTFIACHWFRFNRTWRNSNFRSNKRCIFLAQSTGTTGTILIIYLNRQLLCKKST